MGLFSSIAKVAGIVSAPFSGGSSLALTLGSTALDAASTLYANNQSRKAAATSFDRSLGASNTAYQRATADMRAAGLNPILAYSQGGASTPTAQSASVATPSPMGSNAVNTATALANLGQTETNTRLLDDKAREQRLMNEGLETLSPAARALAGSGSGTAAMAARAGDHIARQLKSGWGKAKDWFAKNKKYHPSNPRK